MYQRNNARPNVTRICTQFLEAKNVLVLPWPVYSPDTPLIEHVWDALDQCVRQHVPVPGNIQQLCTAIEKECDNIPQATINSLINSMQRRCLMMHEANGGHTDPTDWFSDLKAIYDKQMHTCIDWGLMNLFKLTDFLI
jgi:acyl carrier protein phosphodiesterase